MQHNLPKKFRTQCPVCYSNSIQCLWQVTSNQAAQHFVLREKDKDRHARLANHLEHLWNQGICEVSQCDNCAFCFSNPYIAGDKTFYELAYGRTSYPAWKWEFQQTYESLAILFTKKLLKILEIGAGNGSFIKGIMPELANKENVLCTEYSDYGKKEIDRLGIRCFTDNVKNIKLQESLDAIAMFQVLEHMDDLDTLFCKLNSLLSLGGHLFIAVPNNNRIAFNEKNGALLDMPPNHIGRWNRECFSIIGERHGFRLEEHKVEPFHLTSSARQLVMYRYARAAQFSGSIQNRAASTQNLWKRKAFKLIGLAFSSFGSLRALSRMTDSIGNSQWAHYTKSNPSMYDKQSLKAEK